MNIEDREKQFLIDVRHSIVKAVALSVANGHELNVLVDRVKSAENIILELVFFLLTGERKRGEEDKKS